MNEPTTVGSRFDTPPAHEDALRLRAIAILPMAVAGLIWGLVYVVAGVPEVAVWPWTLAVLTTLAIVAYNRGLTWIVHGQVLYG